MSLIIDKVEGNYFEGEMYKPAGRIAYFEGNFFDNDSIIFTELYHVLGRGLVMDGTYPGKILGDTLKGICNFFNVPLPDSTLHRYTLIRDTTFTDKTKDQKIITQAFQKTKQITIQIKSLLPSNKNPFKALDDTKKIKYADLIRKKRDIIEEEYKSIEDPRIINMISEQYLGDTFTLWQLVKNPIDSVWLVDKIEQSKKGEDGYYRKQQMKIRLNKLSYEEYKNFINSMLEKNLSLNDQIDLLFDLSSASRNNPEFESKFNSRYNSLLEKFPDNEDLKRLSEVVESVKVSKKLKVGVMAPDFKIQTLKGDKLKLSDFRNKFVFLDFWGTWCGPCLGELPNNKKLAQSISKDKLKIIGLAQDDEKKLREFLKAAPLPYENAIVTEEVIRSYGITRWPTTFLIDPKGRILAKDLRGEQLVENVRSMINNFK